MNNNFQYRDKEWLFREAIELGKTEKQIAEENNWTQRVVTKWIQIYGLGDNNFKYLKTLSQGQKYLITASLLGDGHVTDDGIFIVSHCQKQKDYLFYKYNILKDCCKKTPSKYDGGVFIKNGKQYNRQEAYRFNTRKIKAIQKLKELSKKEIITNLNEYQLSIWMLDDGYRDVWTWDLCIACLNKEEQQCLHEKLQAWGLHYRVRKDPRYIRFNNASSRKIDNIILKYIPNNLDIIQYKILSRRGVM